MNSAQSPATSRTFHITVTITEVPPNESTPEPQQAPPVEMSERAKQAIKSEADARFAAAVFGR